jgi:hypothetical protein
VTIRARALDASVTADVVITAAQGRQVAAGRSGQPIPVPRGTYDVEVTCLELVDRPTRRLRELEVSEGTVEREVTFPAGRATLHVRREGRPLNDAVVRFATAAGQDLPGTARTGRPFMASPGQYEAQIIIGRGRSSIAHTVSGIQIYEASERHIPVSL